MDGVVDIPEVSIKKASNSEEAINEHFSGEKVIYEHTNCVHYFEFLSVSMSTYAKLEGSITGI